MIPHFHYPDLSNLLNNVSSVFKEWALGESPELDRINEIFKEVEEMRLDLEEELDLASRVSQEAPVVAGGVIDVAATKLPILQTKPKMPAVESPRSQEAHLEWKKLNTCLKRVERMQTMLDKLVEKVGKVSSNEQVDEIKGMLDQLKSTNLLAGIRDDLSSLAVLTEQEAVPGLEQETVRVLDDMEAITTETEKLDDELNRFTPEKDVDKAKAEKLRQVLSEIMDDSAKELEKAVNADIGSKESDAIRLQTTLERYEKIKKELKEKVTGVRNKFSDLQESIESRKRMEAAKKQFEEIKTRQTESSGSKRPIKKINQSKPEGTSTEKVKKIAPHLSEAVKRKSVEHVEIVNQFVDYVLSEKENRTIEPKALEKEFKAWLKQNPGTLHPAVAESFYKANSSKIIEGLAKKPKA